MFWSSFVGKSVGLNVNDQIVCPFEIASQTPQTIQPIFAGLDQISISRKNKKLAISICFPTFADENRPKYEKFTNVFVERG